MNMLRRLLIVSGILLFAAGNGAAVGQTTFKGEKGKWHGFDRYDFIMDEATLGLTPTVVTPEEGMNAKAPEKGTRRCIVVVPEKAAPGNPWTWRGCYWDHEPWAEIELLKRGFHVAYITTDPDETWDAWYEFLVEEHGLSPKPCFIGMSRGGTNSYTWGTAHPDKVTAICVDNPGLTQTALMKTDLLAANDVPLLHVCGSVDPLLNNTYAIQGIYHAAGGRMSVIVKDGPAHHPHSLKSPMVIADFMEQSFQHKQPAAPSFLPERNNRTSFYSTIENYGYRDSEKEWVTTWGSIYNGNYDRYTFSLRGVEGSISVVAPSKPAAGNPWVFRCGYFARDSKVEFALLEKGFYIVTAPVPYNADGPKAEQWSMVYDYLTERGFAKKPVMMGSGGAAGEVYNWAMQNPAKVACVYAENPLMRASLAKTPLMENLAPLANAKVPLIHVCGELDPNLEKQTREVEKRYKQLGGDIMVIVDEGKGHYPMSPAYPDPVVAEIVKNAR